tara:strand:+ start:1167 stop:1505 length:339 start_codon:yes stop_codon:yes gene_type:complete
MYFWILLIGFFYSCVPRPPMDVVLPPTKNIRSDLNKETIYTLGYMSEYEIWEFLKASPSEKDVLETFGLPDSVWLDDRESTKFLYYYISNIQDYNAIEISAKTDSVTGFEWD